MTTARLRRAMTVASRHVGEDVARLPSVPASANGPDIRRARSVVVFLASDDATRSRLALEVARLQWAADVGVPVPAVEFHEDDVLVLERVPDDGELTGRALADLVEVLDRVRAAPPPPPESAASRPTPRRLRRRLATAARTTVAGLPPWQLLAARRAVAAHPIATCHGDCVTSNVMVGRDGTVHLIDFELAGRGPDGWDFARLWPTLPRATDRDVLAAALDDRVGSTRSRELRRWAACRVVSDLLEDGAAVADVRAVVRLTRNG